MKPRTRLALLTALALSGGAAVVTTLPGLSCASPMSGDRPEPLDFGRHTIDLGRVMRPTVLTAFLTGGPMADLVALHVDPAKERHLRVFSFTNGAWTLSIDTLLDPDTVFVDVAHIDGRDRLLTYAPGRVRWFDLDRLAERDLVRVSSNFVPPRPGEVPHVDITRDVNGDRLDDLVVPGERGFWISVQASGAFEPAIQAGAVPDLARILWPDGYRYDPWSQSRIHMIDFDHDGRQDLAYWNEGRFDVHRQEERGTFAAVAQSFPTSVHFDSDRRDMLATGDMVGRVLSSISDVNGDGIADLVVHQLEDKRITHKRSTYRVHLGERIGDATEFAPTAGLVFESDDGIHIDWRRLDVDGDGDLDLALTTIERRFLTTSLWKRFKGAMGDDVWLELELYLFEDGAFDPEPARTHRIALDGAPSHTEPGSVPLDLVLRGATHEHRRTQTKWPRAFNPSVRIGDLTGDGRPDLIVEHDHHTLGAYVGVPGPGLFAHRSRTYRTAVPTDEEYVLLTDLNRDDRRDLLFHHPFLAKDVHGGRKKPPGTEPHRVVLLLGR